MPNDVVGGSAFRIHMYRPEAWKKRYESVSNVEKSFRFFHASTNRYAADFTIPNSNRARSPIQENRIVTKLQTILMFGGSLKASR